MLLPSLEPRSWTRRTIHWSPISMLGPRSFHRRRFERCQRQAKPKTRWALPHHKWPTNLWRLVKHCRHKWPTNHWRLGKHCRFSPLTIATGALANARVSDLRVLGDQMSEIECNQKWEAHVKILHRPWAEWVQWLCRRSWMKGLANQLCCIKFLRGACFNATSLDFV